MNRRNAAFISRIKGLSRMVKGRLRRNHKNEHGKFAHKWSERSELCGHMGKRRNLAQKEAP